MPQHATLGQGHIDHDQDEPKQADSRVDSAVARRELEEDGNKVHRDEDSATSGGCDTEHEDDGAVVLAGGDELDWEDATLLGCADAVRLLDDE